MKEQYQQEMQKIYVPESLLEKTKLAMKEEEKRIESEENKKKIVPFGRISVVAAAAVLLLVIIPVAAGFSGTGTSGNEQTGQLYLSTKEEEELIKIEAEEASGIKAWLQTIMDKIEELLK